MHYKISYKKFWDIKGFVFNQTLNVTLTHQEFKNLDSHICVAKLNAPSWNPNFKIYLNPFKKGINYTTLTQTKFFTNHSHITNNNTNIPMDKRF